jgi:hypothetical protein
MSLALISWRRNRIAPVRSLAMMAMVAMACSGPVVAAEEIESSNPEDVNLTIYNQDFGLVRELRKVDLKQGINMVRVNNVAARIDPTSVSFVSVTAPNSVVVREQNYQYDVLNPTTILSKSVGKQITYRHFVNGSVHEVSGILLNPPIVSISDTNGNTSEQSQGLVLKTDNGVVLNPAGEAHLESLPSGLVSKPSLLWKVEADKGGAQDAEVSYQTSGLTWKCDYVALLNKDDNQIDLNSWVTLDNQCGTGFKNAGVKLIAGDVHKVQPPAQPMMQMYAAGRIMAKAAAPQFEEQSFAEYHLYSLQGKTDVSNNQTKQLSLFTANGAPVKKVFVFEPGSGGIMPMYARFPQQQGDKVHVKIEIENTKKNNLGMAMPAGKVRVYKRDADNALQFIGEDQIDHTPRDEKVRLYIGDAFDLVGEQKQMTNQQIGDRVNRSTYEVSLRNHKTSDVSITVVEHAYPNWTILSSSLPYNKKDAHTFEFQVPVKANGEVKLTYEVETTW